MRGLNFLCLTLTACTATPLMAQQVRGKGLTRTDIENNKYAGFLFTDVKGVQLQFNGFIQSDFLYDFNEMDNRFGFQPSTIPVPTIHESNTAFTVRQSRFAFTAHGSPDDKGRVLEAHMEFDLSASANSVSPRLRHAYMKHGKWLFGQTFSNFMDSEIWPNIMDSQGPNGILNLRQVQLRFTQSLGKNTTLTFSGEQPGSDVTIPSTWKTRTIFPDFTGAIKQMIGKSYVRLSGLFHPITYKNDLGDQKNRIGGAFNFTSDIRVGKQDDILLEFAYGTGYAKYSEGISGQGYDAFAKGEELKCVKLMSTFLFYDWYFGSKFSAALGGGYLRTFGNSEMGPSAFKHSIYTAADITYYFTDFFKISAEVLYGQRKNVDNQEGNNARLQFTAFFKF